MQVYSVKYGKFGMGSHRVLCLYAEYMSGLFGEYRVNIEKPCKNGKTWFRPATLWFRPATLASTNWTMDARPGHLRTA